MNKKGQGEPGFGLGLFLALLGSIIAIVIAVAFFMGAFEGFGEKLKTGFGAGTSVTVLIKSCEVAVEAADGGYLFCSDFKEISFPTGTEWVNCKDSRLEGKVPAFTCNPDEPRMFCESKVRSEALVAGPEDNTPTSPYYKQRVSSCKKLIVNGLPCTDAQRAGSTICAGIA